MSSRMPVRWNPCTAIHWRFNPSGAPYGGLAVLKSAVATISGATRIPFVYDGTTRSVPNSNALDTGNARQQTVVVGWTDRYHTDLLANQTNWTLGMTRTIWYSYSTNSGAPIAAIRGAQIAFNRFSQLPLTGVASWQTTATHELGHLVGLGHSRSQYEIMAPIIGHARYLQAGDRAGLTGVGRGAGCINFPAT